MKVDTKRSPRGRGNKTPQACNFCRLRKSKCNGVKPICDTCATSGHDCTWNAENARRPSTKQYVESLKKRADALEAYAALLESKLEQCRREHGGLNEGGSSYRQLRPGRPILLDDDMEAEHEDSRTTSDDESDILQQICIPAGNLVLEDRDLLFHGATSLFRYSAKVPDHASRFPDITDNPNQSYVLIVDGVYDSHFNPDFDWSRHLPPVVPLDRREHDKVLDLLFKFFYSWCFRIVPALFLRDMYRALSVPRSQPPPKTPHYSPMLHNALIALATAFSDDPRIRDLKSRQYFARAAKEYIEPECQRPNISVVHALSTLASFHSSQGDHTLGYTYFGMSARISQALGLSVDCSTWVKSGLISHDDMLDRNWAHWTTFSQDVCWSLLVGRDFCVPMPSESNWRNIPIPFVDSDFDQIPWHFPQSNLPPQPNFLSKTFAASCELLLIARPIMDVVNGLSSPGSRRATNYELITKIDLQLNGWKEHLSPEVDITLSTRPTATPHRLMLHLSYWWCFILLHRPFYRYPRSPANSDQRVDHVKLCNRAAENIMELLGTWHSLYTLRYVPVTLLQIIFSAGTVFLLAAVQATSGLRVAQVSLAHSLSQADLCVKHLLECGKSWQCSNKIAEILRNLLRDQLEPRLAMREISQRPNENPSATSTSFRRPTRRPRPTYNTDVTSPSMPPNNPTPPNHSPSTNTHSSITSPPLSNHPVSPTPSRQESAGVISEPVSPWPVGRDFFGLLGGEMFPAQPFMPFSILDSGRFDEDYRHQPANAIEDHDPGTSLGLTDADLAMWQQFLNQ